MLAQWLQNLGAPIHVVATDARSDSATAAAIARIRAVTSFVVADTVTTATLSARIRALAASSTAGATTSAAVSRIRTRAASSTGDTSSAAVVRRVRTRADSAIADATSSATTGRIRGRSITSIADATTAAVVTRVGAGGAAGRRGVVVTVTPVVAIATAVTELAGHARAFAQLAAVVTITHGVRDLAQVRVVSAVAAIAEAA